jgi:hypothetical protein
MSIELTGKFLVQKKENSDGKIVFTITGFLLNTPEEMEDITDEMWVTHIKVNETGEGLRFTEFKHGDENIPSPEDFLESGLKGSDWKTKQKLI